MNEIVFMGRGGQGAVVASEILADAYFRQGNQVQAFPSFGVERRGAPVSAFVRIDNEFIYLRSQIYQANYCLVFAANIVRLPSFHSSLKEGATILINSAGRLDDLDSYSVSYIDAAAIAMKHNLGSSTQPIVNTAMVGAFARVIGNLDIESLKESVRSKVPHKVEANIEALEAAYEAVTVGE
ncbi:MAG: 2-oxoacid:acceptor oxidoreductase family protein [Candidatus Zixiibacteriota bacterium]